MDLYPLFGAYYKWGLNSFRSCVSEIFTWVCFCLHIICLFICLTGKSYRVFSFSVFGCGPLRDNYQVLGSSFVRWLTEKDPSDSTMENKNQVATSSPSSSSLDHLFGPMDSNSASSLSTTGYFGSIFPPLVVEREKKEDGGNQVSTGKVVNPDYASVNGKNGTGGASGKDESSIYQNETMEPSYFSSSIFYGGQENYSPRTKASESRHNYKKEGKDDDDANDRNANSASRGNWWKGSLYY